MEDRRKAHSIFSPAFQVAYCMRKWSFTPSPHKAWQIVFACPLKQRVLGKSRIVWHHRMCANGEIQQQRSCWNHWPCFQLPQSQHYCSHLLHHPLRHTRSTEGDTVLVPFPILSSQPGANLPLFKPFSPHF